MALRVHYTQSVGVDVTFESVRLGSVSGLTTNANQGTVGGGTIEIPDKGGLITVRGLKRMYLIDDASPVGATMLFDGYNGPRTLDRGEFLIGTDRWWHCTLVDLNNLLTTFVIRAVAGTPPNSGKRPAETDVERVQWILSTPYMQQVHDYGLVSTAGPVNMDAADYTNQTAADVLRDCGLQAQKQWFVYYDESHTGDTNRGALFYDKSGSDVFNSTLSFSNVEGEWGDIDDPDTLCFQVMPEPSPGIEFDPANVVAGVSMPFQGTGSPTYRTRPATATDFYWRDGTAPSANVKTLALANERADRMLRAVKDEARVVTFRAKLPRAKAGLILAGHRFLAHFEHLDDQLGGTGDFVPLRVLALTFAHDTEDKRYYNIGIRADPPPIEHTETVAYFFGNSGSPAVWTAGWTVLDSLIVPAAGGGHPLYITVAQGPVGATSVTVCAAVGCGGGSMGNSVALMMFEVTGTTGIGSIIGQDNIGGGSFVWPDVPMDDAGLLIAGMMRWASAVPRNDPDSADGWDNTRIKRGTSATSYTIGTGGSVSFTTQSGLLFPFGGDHSVIRFVSRANPANWMEGFIQTYTGTTLLIDANYRSGGSGAHSDWDVYMGFGSFNDLGDRDYVNCETKIVSTGGTYGGSEVAAGSNSGVVVIPFEGANAAISRAGFTGLVQGGSSTLTVQIA